MRRASGICAQEAVGQKVNNENDDEYEGQHLRPMSQAIDGNASSDGAKSDDVSDFAIDDGDEKDSHNEDSDFELDEGAENSGSRGGDADDDDFDSNGSETSSRRRTVRGPKKRKATPPMTDMRLKLRFRGGESSAAFGKLEAAHLGRSEDMVSNDGWKENEIMTNDGTDDDNNVEDVPADMLRNRSDEEVLEEMKAVQGMWEMASVLEYLHLFRPQLNLREEFTAEELERDLVSNVGERGILVDVHKNHGLSRGQLSDFDSSAFILLATAFNIDGHMGLLHGLFPLSLMALMTPKTSIPDEEWQKVLAKYISRQWETIGGSGRTPLKNGKGENPASVYAAMSSTDRVLVLRALCEITLDSAGVSDRLEEAIRVSKLPPKQRDALLNARPKRGVAPVDAIESFRREPLGTDSLDRSYWWLDMGHPLGFRLYRHSPQTGRRGNKLQTWDPPGTWELMASTLEELQGVGGPLSRSQKKADKQLVAELDSVLVELTAKIEAEERMRRARSRLRLDVGIILDGGCGTRARRARKEVNYTFNDFDEMIGEAIRRERRSRRGQTEPSTSSRRPPSPPPAVDEALNKGLRRGRSARCKTGIEANADGEILEEPREADSTDQFNDNEAGEDGKAAIEDAGDTNTVEAELQEEGVELVKESNCSDQAEIRTEVPVNQNGVSSAEAEVSEGEERFRARFSKGDDLECQLKTQGDLPPGDRSEAPVKDSDMGTAPAVGQQ